MHLTTRSIPDKRLLLAVSLLVSCADVAAEPPDTTPGTATTQMTLLAQDNDRKTIDSTPPTPKFDLPELPCDKEQLKGVTKLDAMITEAESLRAATDQVGGHFDALKQSSSTSLNGTVTDQIRGLMAIIEGIEAFDSSARDMAAKARKRFAGTYGDDSAFSVSYREAYSAAESELDAVISDNVKRREVTSFMHHSYKQPPSTNLSWLDSMLEESDGLKTSVIDRVLSSVETDLMVADFKKGQALVDLLQGSRGKLEMIKDLDARKVKVNAALELLETKESARKEEVAEARSKYRMPARFDKSGAPENADELEEGVRKSLEKDGYDVHAVVLASRWIAVKSALGVHLYNQIDFHVAVTSHLLDEAKTGVLDVLYVTGKSGGVEPKARFGRYSTGCVAQMLKENLDR